ncbi:DNA repair protein XRCC4 [Caerostris darwini]|uniref:DNA repair protein XRCC4 n=1 Tax=Caerostris darwini TaxID=1538125 RepID=A0AAV4WA95_9ARAC|nr:DNA repair protein XRCC4 [Caerostris darwini]
MPVQKYLTELRLQSEEMIFLIVEYETDKTLSLKILNVKHKEIFEGEARNLELRTQAVKNCVDFGEYVSDMTRALFKAKIKESKYLYSFEKKNDDYIFKWKIKDADNIINDLGYVILKKGDFVFALRDYLVLLSNDMKKLHAKEQELSIQLQESKKETNEALRQLSLATHMKETLEKELYSKFVLVLNEKKRKIKELEQKYKVNHLSSNNNPKKSRLDNKLEMGSSDSSDEVDEPEDVNQPGPSNKQKSLLFPDENKPVVPTSSNKIRNRKIPNYKKNNTDNPTTSVNSSPSNNNVAIEDSESDEDLLELV